MASSLVHDFARDAPVFFWNRTPPLSRVEQPRLESESRGTTNTNSKNQGDFFKLCVYGGREDGRGERGEGAIQKISSWDGNILVKNMIFFEGEAPQKNYLRCC